jgi:hypothetical protein
MIALIGTLFFVFAGVSEAVMDTLQFHYSYSIFYYFRNKLFWDPSTSWKNKYKNGDPLAGPKFPGSTTIFVGLTDAWHLFKLLRNLFIFSGVLFIAIPCSNIWMVILWVVVARILFGLSFTFFYKILGD